MVVRTEGARLGALVPLCWRCKCDSRHSTTSKNDGRQARPFSFCFPVHGAIAFVYERR